MFKWNHSIFTTSSQSISLGINISKVSALKPTINAQMSEEVVEDDCAGAGNRALPFVGPLALFAPAPAPTSEAWD